MPNPREPDEGGEEEEEALPEVPAVPTLPEAPKLTPKLPPHPKKTDEGPSEQQRMGIAYMIPVLLITPIVVLTLLGAWLDSRYHTSPNFTLGGALLGIISGFVNMIRTANKLNK